jgi:hypothetical protein
MPRPSVNIELARSFVEWLRKNAPDDESLDQIAALTRWIQVGRSTGYFNYGMEHRPDRDRFPNDADIHHSALLSRLRSGKDPLPKPPPHAFSSPWYSVMEEDGPHDCEVGEIMPVEPWMDASSDSDKPRIAINQDLWIVEKQVSDDELLVRWLPGYPLFRLTKKTVKVDDFWRNWTIERVQVIEVTDESEDG